MNRKPIPKELRIKVYEKYGDYENHFINRK